jgi:DNA mismatch endonuclease (patch repair protein)
MPPARAPEVTSRIMSAVRGRDTRPEIALRRALHAKGLRFRVQYRSVRGRPDVAFPTRRIAVFVDGDFWHGNAWRLRGDRSLKSQFARWRNTDFWLAKIRSNIARDHKVTRELTCAGWTVIRFWESDVVKDLNACVSKVLRAHAV